jgi:hypothetical protein
MGERRTLTREEKKKIRNDRRAVEEDKNPGLYVYVRVEDKTDENGEPIVKITRFREGELPPPKPRKYRAPPR